MSTAVLDESTSQAYRELQETLSRLARGNRDPSEMQRACARMDQMREELRSRIGTVEMAVDLIREARNP